jgi:hypothetical protein
MKSFDLKCPSMKVRITFLENKENDECIYISIKMVQTYMALI